MADSVSSSLVTIRASCPLCASSARREVDTLIFTLQHPCNHDIDVVGIDPISEPIDYHRILGFVRGLLEKIPDHKTGEFGLDDLIIHAQKHPLVTQMTGLPIKSEGALLFAGEAVYQSPDLKDALRYIIAKSIEQIESGKLKITPTFALNAIALLWRMSGTSGDDEFLKAMHEKVTSGAFDVTSPLGKAYQEKQERLNSTAKDMEATSKDDE